jgi:NTE family protein
MPKLARTSEPAHRKARQALRFPPFNCVALVLQGGGALGAYQGGVYQALTEADLHPDWVAGISIGAINGAIIAGNPPEKRVERLRVFWEKISANPVGGWAYPWLDDSKSFVHPGEMTHGLINQFSALQALVAGAPGFFKPRFPQAWFFPSGSPESTSFYDTAALKSTLESLVDFDRINGGVTRFSIGAVNVRTGNFIYFDTSTHTIRPEHVLASGALPPGFPAIEIDGEHYWDGGLVSNTPLQWIVGSKPRQDTLAFQVDLWSSRGAFPGDLAEVGVRQKEIQYSSRTRASTDQLKELQKIRSTLFKFLHDLPKGVGKTAEGELLSTFADPKAYNIVQLIYRSKHYEGNSKDYEFSRTSVTDHWRAGYEDAVRALQHKEIFERPGNKTGFQSFDFDDHLRADRESPRRQDGGRS